MEAERLYKVRFARAFRSKPFALLWTGQTISILGNGAFVTTLAWQVLILTKSATAMGLVVTAETLPMLLFLLIGGVTADRLPRRFIMLFSDFIRGCAVFVIAGLSWLHLLELWHVIVLSLIFGFAKSFFQPAYAALRPQLVKKEDLISANSLNALSQRMNQLVGPLIGSALVALAGPALAFAFDGLTFGVSAVCLLALRVPLEKDILEKTQKTSESTDYRIKSNYGNSRMQKIRGLFLDIKEGFDYVISTTWLRASLIIAAVINVTAWAPFAVSLPILISHSYHADIWFFGMLTTVTAIGSVSANVLIGQVEIRHRGMILYSSLAISSLGLLVLGFPLPYVKLVTASIASLSFGFGTAIFGILWETLLQELVPTSKLGRVESLDTIGSYCLLPVGYSLCGFLTDRWSPTGMFILGGGISLIIAFSALCVKDIRTLK